MILCVVVLFTLRSSRVFGPTFGYAARPRLPNQFVQSSSRGVSTTCDHQRRSAREGVDGAGADGARRHARRGLACPLLRLHVTPGHSTHEPASEPRSEGREQPHDKRGEQTNGWERHRGMKGTRVGSSPPPARVGYSTEPPREQRSLGNQFTHPSSCACLLLLVDDRRPQQSDQRDRSLLISFVVLTVNSQTARASSFVEPARRMKSHFSCSGSRMASSGASLGSPSRRTWAFTLSLALLSFLLAPLVGPPSSTSTSRRSGFCLLGTYACETDPGCGGNFYYDGCTCKPCTNPGSWCEDGYYTACPADYYCPYTHISCNSDRSKWNHFSRETIFPSSFLLVLYRSCWSGDRVSRRYEFSSWLLLLFAVCRHRHPVRSGIVQRNRKYAVYHLPNWSEARIYCYSALFCRHILISSDLASPLQDIIARAARPWLAVRRGTDVRLAVAEPATVVRDHTSRVRIKVDARDARLVRRTFVHHRDRAV
jgi:hypothetical protein